MKQKDRTINWQSEPSAAILAKLNAADGFPGIADALFGQPWIYETGLLDEFAVNAYWVGHYTECLDACLQIVRTEKMDSADLQRVVANAQYALQKITALMAGQR
jgi:hypothetical protein